MAYYGIYRGTALNTLDPLGQGRMQVVVPALPSVTLAWASPCRDYKNTQTMPPIGTQVWVMFENGNISHPVWMGCAT